jgi:hypothetical protein
MESPVGTACISDDFWLTHAGDGGRESRLAKTGSSS